MKRAIIIDIDETLIEGSIAERIGIEAYKGS